MKIRFTTNAQRQGVGFRRGQVVDWPEADAAAYVNAGQAEVADRTPDDDTFALRRRDGAAIADQADEGKPSEEDETQDNDGDLNEGAGSKPAPAQSPAEVAAEKKAKARAARASKSAKAKA